MTPRILTLVAVAVSVTAAVASLVSLPILAIRFKLTWGGEFYLMEPLPHVILAAMAIAFRRTIAGATISLIGALAIGGFGIYAMYDLPDAMGVAMLPLVLLFGCGIVLLAQLVGWAVMRG